MRLKIIDIVEAGIVLGGLVGLSSIVYSHGKSVGKVEERQAIVEEAKMDAYDLREFARTYESLTGEEQQEYLTRASALEDFAKVLSHELSPKD